MEGLMDFNNILDPEQINDLFTGEEETPPTEEQKPSGEEANVEETLNTKNNEITDVPINELFGETQESVGNEDNNTKEVKETPPPEKKGESSNFYSSIAKALKEDGVFPDLDDDSVSGSDSAEKFRELINKQVEARLNETQKRINEALNLGVEPDEIKTSEGNLAFLKGLKEEQFNDASGEEGENLRKNLIYNDFINRGYSEERAAKEVKKSFDAGTDFEDAKEALASNIDFYNKKYNALIEEKKALIEKENKAMQEFNDSVSKEIIEGKDAFEGYVSSKDLRQKIYKNISKRDLKDKDGNPLTALEKYQRENPIEFVKKLGYLFTVTDGFKNLDNLLNSKVKEEAKKGVKNLEKVINSTSRNNDGSFKFVTGSSDDANANFNNFEIDLNV